MKTKIAAAVLFAALLSAAPRVAEASWSVSISFFHQELEPYGRWVYTPAYGEVWYPTVVRAGWAPYVYGEWVYSDCGWTWVSYDPFSDPFHYGTWVWIEPYGWCWEPGYVWGPAWVTWAWTDTYIGWAPLPPTFAMTGGGYFGGAVTVPASRYVFAPVTQFAGTNISTVRVATTQNPTILTHAQRTTRYSISGGLVRASGPPATLVERGTGRPLHAAKVTSLRNVRPTMVSTSHGGKLSIVAPARDRAAAVVAKGARSTGKAPPHSMVAGREAKTTKANSQKATTSKPVHREKETARVSRTERHAPPPAVERHEARPIRHQEKAPAGPPPARPVERKHETGPPPQARAPREEHRAAMSRPAEPPHPARAEAPPPRVAQPQPQAAPAPAAAKPPGHPQPQGPGKGPKKEKG